MKKSSEHSYVFRLSILSLLIVVCASTSRSSFCPPQAPVLVPSKLFIDIRCSTHLKSQTKKSLPVLPLLSIFTMFLRQTWLLVLLHFYLKQTIINLPMLRLPRSMTSEQIPLLPESLSHAPQHAPRVPLASPSPTSSPIAQFPLPASIYTPKRLTVLCFTILLASTIFPI